MGVGLYVDSNFNRVKPFESASSQVKQPTLQEQSATIGEVKYIITPKNINSDIRTWDFEIILDTHTGSLDQDLVSIIRIVDNKGIEYQANKWVGDPPGGHHREGILEFSPITPYPSSIELKIQTTDTTKETTFRWNI